MDTNPRTTAPAAISRRDFIGLVGGSAAYAIAGPRTTAYGSPASTSPTARVTLERYLGATRSVIEELTAHIDDDYYLGTPYGNTGPGEFGSDLTRWDCWHPNGKPSSSGQSYMNCTGFMVAVFEACGADCDPVGSYVDATGYNVGNKANLSRWRHFLDGHASMRTRYESKSELLASGHLRKGDIIIAEPNDWSQPGADNHVLFFWGDTPDHDLAWHSSSKGDGIIAGKAPGNMISKITAKTADCYWLHVPLTNLIDLVLTKTSANIELSGKPGENEAYSLAGASFSVFRSFENGTLSDLVTTFTTDEKGTSSIRLTPGEKVWVRENEAPLGFVRRDEPWSLTVGGSEHQEVELENTPCSIRVIAIKEDAETGNRPQGWATLGGAAYELVDANGSTHLSKTIWNSEDRAWIATFEGLPRGDARIREATPPEGYLLDTTGDDGWRAISLTPDSHDIVFIATLDPHRENVVRGDISGAKFKEAGGEDESRKDPLAGCEFAIWLQDDGSLESKGYVVQAILDANGNPLAGAPAGALMGSVKSHEDGRFSTKDLLDGWNPDDHGGAPTPEHALPYGTYTIVETFCPDPSCALIEPIRDIEVRAHGQEVFLILEDERIASPVRIRKVDAATGRPLKKPGTVVELLRKQDDGTFVPLELADRYPVNSAATSFVIGAEGYIWLPAKLEWGTYAIREIKAVPPYLLSDAPVVFTIDEEHDWDEDAIEISLENTAATGAIVGQKTDAEDGRTGIEGAVFEVRAAEDVEMPDGTVALSAGEIVGTASTNESGAWRMSGLPLGNGIALYEVREIEAPSGYLLDTAVRTIAIEYAGDRTPEVEYSIDFKEQPTEIEVLKVDAETREGIEGVEISVLVAEEAALEDTATNEKGCEPCLVATCMTDERGVARFLRLDGDVSYLIEETAAREDLGYVANRIRFERYLSPEGRWFESREAYEKGSDRISGAERLSIEMENDFTRIVVYKVDADAWNSLQQCDESTPEKDRIALERAALLSGGVFRLADEAGNILSIRSVPNDEADEWSQPENEPQTLARLPAGEHLDILEIAAPDGYLPSSEKMRFVVEKTVEPQPVVVTNRKIIELPKTADSVLAVAAGIGVVAAGSAALAICARKEALSRRKASHAAVCSPAGEETPPPDGDTNREEPQ